MTTPYQSKLDAERERQARRLGLPLWAFDAAQAVDDKLLNDLRRDNIRPGPTEAEIAEACASAEANGRAYEAFQAGIPEVLRRAGYDPAVADEHLHGWAERFLRECGGHVGAATSKLIGLYPKRG